MTATTRRVRVAMLAALLGALFAAPLASAQTVWRLAGSFNAWNTMDDDWAMSPVPGSEGEYELFRIVDPGRYVFKFVRDGSWSAGHFGRAEDGTLEQPGRDLVFTSRATALYRITLDTRSLMWSVEVADVDEPVLITHVLGQPSVGRTFMIDASESLIPEGASAAISVSSPNQTVRVTPSGSALRAYVTSNRVGPLVLDVTLGAGADEVVERLSLEVEPRFNLAGRAPGETRSRCAPSRCCPSPPASTARSSRSRRAASPWRRRSAATTGASSASPSPTSRPACTASRSATAPRCCTTATSRRGSCCRATG